MLRLTSGFFLEMYIIKIVHLMSLPPSLPTFRSLIRTEDIAVWNVGMQYPFSLLSFPKRQPGLFSFFPVVLLRFILESHTSIAHPLFLGPAYLHQALKGVGGLPTCHPSHRSRYFVLAGGAYRFLSGIARMQPNTSSEHPTHTIHQPNPPDGC